MNLLPDISERWKVLFLKLRQEITLETIGDFGSTQLANDKGYVFLEDPGTITFPWLAIITAHMNQLFVDMSHIGVV